MLFAGNAEPLCDPPSLSGSRIQDISATTGFLLEADKEVSVVLIFYSEIILNFTEKL